jgi:butyryl-CoA dehydrogenase
MSYQLTEEQQLIQQSAREFTQEFIEPAASGIDKIGTHPTEIFQKLAEYDYLGLYLPSNFGGSDAGFLSFALIVEELSRVSGAVASIVVNHTVKAAYTICQWGTERQKQAYLGSLCKGEKVGAIAIDEPGAAVGAGPDKVVAVKQDSGYVLTGKKVYVANGGAADVYIVIAATTPEMGPKGLSAFIVDANTSGFSVVRVSEKMGLRGCQSAEISFDNAFVPQENLLGPENGAQALLAEIAAVASVAEGAQVVGIAQAAMKDAAKYAKQRVQFGRPIASFPAIQNMLAEIAANIYMLRLAVYDAAALIEKGEPFASEAAMIKLNAYRIGQSALIDVIQIEGGYGYSEEMVVSRFYRDVKGVILKDSSADFPEKVIAAELLA